ncbi:uncharacterized protein LOC122195695 [Lactuca sativa]|uniref:uncharacterized protein LOC122195695 n=1 Tax=Lactuca sativa TaxID=4236 RepID=UPI001C68E7B6|nr:uncharacterized protein LOC122195695 [Lactuca sativa]
MPSGPKKRRAAKKKNDAGTEEKPVAAVESVSNVSEMSVGDPGIEAFDESQAAARIALQSQLMCEKENVEESKNDAVGSESVGYKSKESEYEYESSEDEFKMHVPLLEMLSEAKSTVSNGNKYDSVNQVILQVPHIEFDLKETKETECVEACERVSHAPPGKCVLSHDSFKEPPRNPCVVQVSSATVSHVVSVMKDDGHISMEGDLQEFMKQQSGSTVQMEVSSIESHDQFNGFRDEVVGLLKTLLEGNGRLKTMCQEMMCHITEISLQVQQLLEKIDSGKLIT